MNLSQKVSQFMRDTTIGEFKEKYPEVYDWFNSDVFISMFENDKVSLRTEYRKGLERKPLECLPFKDNQGSVDLDAMVEYLKSEGFLVKLDMGMHTLNLTHLIIELGE